MGCGQHRRRDVAGRNEAFNHAGNATAAGIAGFLAHFYGPEIVFWLLAAMALASIAATLSTPREAGYNAAFLLLAGVAAIGLALFAVMMPETAPYQGRSSTTSKDRPARVMSGR